MTSGERTKGADLLALADRVEKLTGPDRTVDGAVWAAVQGVELLIFENPPSSGEVLSYRGSLNYPELAGVGPYTASLDAAMTLVPGNWRIMRLEDMLACRWDVELVEIHSAGNNVYEHRESKAATPALALTAACLRALTRFREAHAGGGA